MSTAKHNERYWQILQFNIEWLRFSETKATLVLTVYGILLTIIYTNSTSVFTSIQESGAIFYMVLIYSATIVASIVFAFLCISPRLKNTNNNSNKSIIYFGVISSKFPDKSAYKTLAKSVLNDEEDFGDHIIDQIYTISKIASKKYYHVTWAMRLFIASLIWLILILVIYLFKNK